MQHFGGFYFSEILSLYKNKTPLRIRDGIQARMLIFCKNRPNSLNDRSIPKELVTVEMYLVAIDSMQTRYRPSLCIEILREMYDGLPSRFTEEDIQTVRDAMNVLILKRGDLLKKKEEESNNA